MNDLVLRSKEVESVVATFTTEERQVYEELREMIANTCLEELKARYNIAKYVHNLYVKQKEQKIYGERFFSRLAKALGFRGENVLREMYIVVERWPEFEVLEKSVLSVLGNARWKDLILLAKAEESEYQELLEEIKSGLSLTEITDKRREKLADSRGRKPNMPAGLDDYIGKLSKLLQQTFNKLVLWDEFDIIDNVSNITAQEQACKYIEKLTTLVTMLDEVVKQCSATKNNINSAIKYIDEFVLQTLNVGEVTEEDFQEDIVSEEEEEEYDEDSEEYVEEEETEEELEDEDIEDIPEDELDSEELVDFDEVDEEELK